MDNQEDPTERPDSAQGDETPDSVQSFTDTSPLVELFGTKTRVEITDALLRNPRMDLTASEIADLAGRHPSSFYRHEGALRELNILKKGRKVGGTQLYGLKESPVSRHLRKAQAAMVKGGSTIQSIRESVDQDVEELPREPAPPEPREDIPQMVAEEIREELKPK